jgi:hypothetical protein
MLLFATVRNAIEKKKIEFFFDKCIKRDAKKNCNRIKN